MEVRTKSLDMEVTSHIAIIVCGVTIQGEIQVVRHEMRDRDIGSSSDRQACVDWTHHLDDFTILVRHTHADGLRSGIQAAAIILIIGKIVDKAELETGYSRGAR